MRLIPHKLKNLWLRWRRGAGCCDAYSLFYYLSPIIAKGLKAFKHDKNSHPASLTTEKWDKILDEMIWTFEYLGADDYYGRDEKLRERANKGLRLFAKYFTHLWW